MLMCTLISNNYLIIIFTKWYVDDYVSGQTEEGQLGGKTSTHLKPRHLVNPLSEGAAWHERHHLHVLVFIWQ